MHGLGNDFIIFDNVKNSIIYDSKFIKKISNRRIGIGCDQVLIIEDTNNPENFEVKIYNSDGSETGACGNGTRCVADHLMKKNDLNSVTIKSISDDLVCYKTDNLVNDCLCGNILQYKKNLSELYTNTINQIFLLRILNNKIQRLLSMKEKQNNLEEKHES